MKLRSQSLCYFLYASLPPNFPQPFLPLFNYANSQLRPNPSVVISYIFPCSSPGLLLHLEHSFLVCCQKTHALTLCLWFRPSQHRSAAFPLDCTSQTQSSLPAPAPHASGSKPHRYACALSGITLECSPVRST